MASLSKLKAEAAQSARWRGHSLGRWVSLGRGKARARCQVCGMEVDVNTDPLPNEIDIGGEAVALNCE